MRIADLIKKKNIRVRVRVPAKLQGKLGSEVDGIVLGVEMKKGITWVRVKLLKGRGEHDFRPQDLSPR
jgi:hypothetical protein